MNPAINFHLVWIMLVVMKMVDELHDVVGLEAAALTVELLRPPVRQVLSLQMFSKNMAEFILWSRLNKKSWFKF